MGEKYDAAPPRSTVRRATRANSSVARDPLKIGGAGRQAAAQHRECLGAEVHGDATFLNEASSELVRVADRRNENERVGKWVGTIERRQARDDLSRLPAARPAGDYFDCWHAAIVGNGYGTYKCSMCRLCYPACPC